MSRVPCLLLLGAFAALGCNDPSSPSSAGRIAWHHPFDAGGSLIPAFDADAVYFAGFTHQVLKLDKRDGRTLWSADTHVSGEFTAGVNLVIAGDVVVVGDIDLYAYNRTTGEHAWTFRAPGSDEAGRVRMATDGTTIYAGSLFGRLFAIDPATGQARWSLSLGAHDSLNVTRDPVLKNGTLYVNVTTLHRGPMTCALFAIRANDGHVLWRRDLVPEHPEQGLATSGGAVVAGSVVVNPQGDGRIVAFDTATGAVRWTAPIVYAYQPDRGGTDQRWLATSGSIVVATSTGTDFVVGLDAESGRELWRTETLGNAQPRVTLSGNTVYFATNFRLLVALEADNGAQLWDPYRPTHGDATWWTAPVADGHRLYASASDGFYAIAAR